MDVDIFEYCGKCGLVDAIHDTVIVLDNEGRIRRWNAAAALIIGRSSLEAVGNRVLDLELELLDEKLDPIADGFFLGPFNRRMKGSELALRRADGSIIWFSADLEPLDGSGGVFVLRDVTEFKRTHDALRESEEKFRAMAEALSAAFGMVCGTRFVYANRYFSLLSGYSVEELLKLDFPALVHPDFREAMLERALRRQRGELLPTRYDFKMITKSGEERWVDFSVAPTVYRGQPAIIGTGFDITDRKIAEATLRESEAKLKAFSDNAPLLMGVVDLLPDDSDTIHIYDNPASCAYLGLPPGATANRRSSELGVPREAYRDWVKRYREAERAGEPVHFEYQDFRPGSLRWAEVTLVYIGAAEAGRSRFIYIAQDITERKLDEQALKEAKSAAEHANAAKDQFLAVLSHELRTPLTPVLGGVMLLEQRPDLDPEDRQLLEMIRRNVTLEAQLIDDLLDLTRIARGKIVMHRAAVDVREPLEQAIQVCRGDVEARKQLLAVSLPTEPLPMVGDAARLQQVFWNLLKNAVKFSPEGGLVSVGASEESGSIVVEVTDRGVGIEKEDLERIFNAFEQAGYQNGRSSGGLGLGLSISRRLVELHGGQISAFSEGTGRGSVFTVKLPRAEAAEQPKEQHTPSSSERVGHKLILLVEDHYDTALMMRRILQKAGYLVETAVDVKQALEAIAEKRFDVMISDLGLPDRSGLELMEEVRKSSEPVKGIALSGFGSADDVQRSKEAGFAEHLTKPVDVNALIRTVERIA